MLPSVVGGSARASFTASAGAVGAAADGAVVCRYGIAADEDASKSLHIGDMLFKPVGGSAQASASVGATQTAEAAQLIYAVQWEASSMLADLQQHTGRRAMRHSLRWDLGSRSHVRLHAGAGAMSFHAVQSSLSLLQMATKDKLRAPVALSTQLLMPGVSYSPAHAAVAGLVKVAARESIGQHFAHFTHDAFTAHAAHLPAEASDMFGAGIAGKLQHGRKNDGLDSGIQLCSACPSLFAATACSWDALHTAYGGCSTRGGLGAFACQPRSTSKRAWQRAGHGGARAHWSADRPLGGGNGSLFARLAAGPHRTLFAVYVTSSGNSFRLCQHGGG